MNISGENAQSFIDVIDEVLLHLPNGDLVTESNTTHFIAGQTLDILPSWLRKLCLKALCKICGHQALLPHSMQIPLSCDDLGSPQCYGGFSEVRKGRYQGREVAVKALTVYQTSDFDKIRRVSRQHRDGYSSSCRQTHHDP